MREVAVLLPDERREAVLAQLARDGKVLAAELAARLGVSDDTVRRDLDELAAAGRLRRVRGGALPATSPTSPSFDERRGDDVAAKERIAARTATLLRGDAVVALGGGTTTLAVARALAGAADPPPRTVLTTSPDVALTLGARTEVLLAGGRLHPASHTVIGAEAVAAVSRVRADAVVLGACSLQAAAGLTTHDAGEAEVLRAMAGAAARVVVTAAGGKLGHVAAHVVAAAADVAQVVTDASAPVAELEALRGRGVEVVLA